MTSVQLACVQCVSDSTRLSADVLRRIELGPEMQDPVQSPSPLILRHHSYTHISVDPSHNSSDFQVVFLSLREYSTLVGGGDNASAGQHRTSTKTISLFETGGG